MADHPILDVDVEMTLGTLAIRARFVSSSRRIAIVGPSGAGKSTLLRILGGLERSARGQVRCRGKTWLETKSRVWVEPWARRAAWVPQDSRLFPNRSVRRNLSFAGASDDRVVAMAGRLGVAGLLDRMPRHLSGGETQRVGEPGLGAGGEDRP